MEEEIDQCGTRRTDDHMLDDAPDGIFVWEGDHKWIPGGYFNPEEGEMEPVGEFRMPTEEEWQAIKENRNPWPLPT